jgi:hypothetical protein
MALTHTISVRTSIRSFHRDRVEAHAGGAGQDGGLVGKANGAIAALREFTDFQVVVVRSHRDVLAHEQHSPGDVAQSQANGFQPVRNVTNGIEFQLVGFFSRAIAVVSDGA